MTEIAPKSVTKALYRTIKRRTADVYQPFTVLLASNYPRHRVAQTSVAELYNKQIIRKECKRTIMPSLSYYYCERERAEDAATSDDNELPAFSMRAAACIFPPLHRRARMQGE